MNSETVLLEGHIIDSLILAKVLDTVHQMGGTFDLDDVKIGTTRENSSHAKIHGEMLSKFVEPRSLSAWDNLLLSAPWAASIAPFSCERPGLLRDGCMP